MYCCILGKGKMHDIKCNKVRRNGWLDTSKLLFQWPKYSDIKLTLVVFVFISLVFNSSWNILMIEMIFELRLGYWILWFHTNQYNRILQRMRIQNYRDCIISRPIPYNSFCKKKQEKKDPSIMNLPVMKINDKNLRKLLELCRVSKSFS